MIAVRAPAHLHDIALRGGGRLSRRGADTLDVHEDARNLSTCRVADQLLLQREAGTTCRVHYLCPCERCAEDCAHCADLVLHLEECAADPRQQLCHLLRDLRRRRDGVAREERHACGDSTLGDRLIALHQPCFALAHLTPSSLRISQSRDSASRTVRMRYSPPDGRA